MGIFDFFRGTSNHALPKPPEIAQLNGKPKELILRLMPNTAGVSPDRMFVWNKNSISYLKNVKSFDNQAVIPRAILCIPYGSKDSSDLVCIGAQRADVGEHPSLTVGIARSNLFYLLAGASENYLIGDDFFLKDAFNCLETIFKTDAPVYEVDMSTKKIIGEYTG